MAPMSPSWKLWSSRLTSHDSYVSEDTQLNFSQETNYWIIYKVKILPNVITSSSLVLSAVFQLLTLSVMVIHKYFYSINKGIYDTLKQTFRDASKTIFPMDFIARYSSFVFSSLDSHLPKKKIRLACNDNLAHFKGWIRVLILVNIIIITNVY